MSVSKSKLQALSRTLSVWAFLGLTLFPIEMAAAQNKTEEQKRVNSQPAYDGQITRSFTQPVQESIVSSTETGVINKILVEEGASVAADQILGKLDTTILEQSLRMAQARVDSTARMEAARLRSESLSQRLDTVESLEREGHSNPYEVAQIKLEFDTAIAEFRALQEEKRLNEIEVDRIVAQIEQRQIKSPFDGVVIRIHRQPGELIAATEPQFATIVRLDELKARFYLESASLKSLKSGQSIQVLVGEPKVERWATVSFVSPIVDPESGTRRVDLLIDNHDRALLSGTMCYWQDAKPQTDVPLVAESGIEANQ